MGTLDGKVALITGGARGQGAAEGRLFAAQGARVFLTDVLIAEGKATADEIGDAAAFLEHDVTSPEAWTAVVNTVLGDAGRIDVLVNNAGIFRVIPLTTTDIETWNQVIAINQTGVFLGMKAVSTSMIAQRSGSIINISSIAGLRGSGAAFAYGASKWAVRGMTKSAAQELAPHGIRVNSVHPGIIDTQMITEFGENWREALLPLIPAGRVADADDVAKLVLYLASDDSSYSNGAEFVVDGAFTA
jgi:3alpha(or 20beta)-hydroxysteroid dehydrogenase